MFNKELLNILTNKMLQYSKKIIEKNIKKLFEHSCKGKTGKFVCMFSSIDYLRDNTNKKNEKYSLLDTF